ncbi:MAG: protein NO VEIN domain-containing protein [Phycisphaerales bacterium]
MEQEQTIFYFNNTRNRDHVKLYGSGAFFDLSRDGRQGTQARGLALGQLCVVAEKPSDGEVAFGWYSFSDEAMIRDPSGVPCRVFFGRHLGSETVPKEAAVASREYAAFFTRVGGFKRGSVFRAMIPPELVPPRLDGGEPMMGSDLLEAAGGSGFGDPASNRLVEAAAVRAVVSDYEQGGWSVRSVERDKCGFDLECTRGDAVEQVEVKGVHGRELRFMITAGEVKQACNNPRFHLVVVTSACSPSPIRNKFSGAEFNERFALSATQYRATLKR